MTTGVSLSPATARTNEYHVCEFTLLKAFLLDIIPAMLDTVNKD